MRFASLGSGSRGNALIVEAGNTRVLVDCGFGLRDLASRLSRYGLSPEDIDAVLVTHEHGDHIAGVARLAAKHATEVFLTHGTLVASGFDPALARVFDSHLAFTIGDIEVRPFPVPHDAREPVQFVLSDGKCRLGVLTDAGVVTAHIVEMLKDCEALVLECNHDAEMLAGGDYPWPLKQRIAGRFGHLDNASAADLLRRVRTDRLRHVVAAHLSEQNNAPELARIALAQALGCEPAWVGVADQETGFDWRSLD